MAASQKLKDTIAAANAEPEPEPDPEPDPAAEPEPAAEPDPAPAPAEPEPAAVDAEALAEAIKFEDSRHELELARLMRVDPPLIPCEACGALGYFHPSDVAPKTNEQFIACATCNGLGEVLTGSRRQGHIGAECPACGGRGYLVKLEPTPPPPAAVDPSQAAGNGEAVYGRPSWLGDPSLGGPTP